MTEIEQENFESASRYVNNNFLLAKELSEKAKSNRTVFPSGNKAKVINPNAKPFKLDPPQ